MNTAVIYKSKYGATKQYAEWIAEELSCPIFEHSVIKPKDLQEYDLIIYGGGLYANAIHGVRFVTKNTCKKLIVFTTGLTSQESQKHEEILNQNKLQPTTKLFYFRGGLDYRKLKLLHRVGLKILGSIIRKKQLETRTEDEKVILETIGGKIDFTDKSFIQPLIEHVRGTGE